MSGLGVLDLSSCVSVAMLPESLILLTALSLNLYGTQLHAPSWPVRSPPTEFDQSDIVEAIRHLRRTRSPPPPLLSKLRAMGSW